ncbi:hypothetical protein D9Q98_007677 [Chlorella vulgaris]|uniref:Nucleotide-diphospho-sugar transferase domain-containing protein n=1 Tax=Chlorella vulgaris TaxID=3077 RepID=A0A9D4YTR1_CHLVU|nr:hypothetical protein D9Q98_007677 [Chlorella vulgaris]
MFVRAAPPASASRWHRRSSLLLVGISLSSFLLGLLAAGCGPSRGVTYFWQAASPPQRSGVPAPTLAAFRRVQANPAILGSPHGASLLAEFVAAPWLLPPRTATVPYAGTHSLDALLGLRARPVGRHRSGVAMLLFDRHQPVMAQNSVYSLVRFGGVRNYVMLTWTAADLAACADLNLPCADVAALLAEPLSGVGKPRGRDLLVLMWLKVAAVLRALQLGHVAMMADTDVAYSLKPLWGSLLAFAEAGGADGTMQQEQPFNTGHVLLLPTPAGLAFASKWNSSAAAMLQRGFSEQYAVRNLAARRRLLPCASLCSCFNASRVLQQEGQRHEVPVLRGYPPVYLPYTLNACSVGSMGWVPRMDPCDWAVLYVHPTCTKGTRHKQDSLRQAGFWLLDNNSSSSSGTAGAGNVQGCPPQLGTDSQMPACQPLVWRLPEAEAEHTSCPSYGLGLMHGGDPPAASALRGGALIAAEAAKLIDVGHRC